jgi:hypothetical protein
MLSDTIAEVKSIMGAVAGVGKVNAYRRNAKTEQDFNDLYVVNGKVLAWDITRESTASTDRTVGATYEEHTLVIRGYMGVRDFDGTEKTFQDLIESVRAALRVKRNLNGKVLDTTPVQARQVGAAEFGVNKVLVHYCELSFTAIEFPVSTT